MKFAASILLLWTYGFLLPQGVDSCAATAANSHPPVRPLADCGTMCQPLQELRNSSDDQTVTQTQIEDAGNGCPGFSQTCRGQNAQAAVIITWYDQNGNDVGSAFGTGSATSAVACTSANVLTYNGTTVNQVECVSA